MKHVVTIMVLSLAALPVLGERINHEGRILGPLPVVTNAVLFNTPEADAMVAAMQILPVTNPWNEDISQRHVLPNSDAMIAQITADLQTNRRTLRAFKEMNFVLVPEAQPAVPIQFMLYPGESDFDGGTSPYGQYPIPSNLPIELWPSETGTQTLSQWQEDVNNWGGDRHAVIVKPGSGVLWETWQARLVSGNWRASNGAKFDLNSNGLRPAGWTSADAAGLPMFPALVRFDECERGVIEHALRIVVAKSRRQYIYPATHFASSIPASETNVPAMGQRLRLKSSFVIPEHWTKQEKIVLRALQKYGALVADNGNFFSISVTPDDRWPAGCFNRLSSVGITNFEAILTTGPTEGPRSPGAPVAHAAAQLGAIVGVPVALNGFVQISNALPTAVQWRRYSGPAEVGFADATLTNTMATFPAPGVYTLMLSASNGVHAVAYAATVVTITTGIHLTVARAGANLHLNWTGGTPPFVVEHSDTLPATSWSSALTTSAQTVSVPLPPDAGYFRIRSQ